MDTIQQVIFHSRCEKLQAPSYINLALSIFILLGILVSYLPQHHRIISRGSSEGISPYFILLGTTSGTCSFATILMLPASRADVACCKTVSTFECIAGLLGIAQVGMQWACFSVILLLYLIFFPRASALPTNASPNTHTWRTAVHIGLICLAHGLLVILISSTIVFSRPESLGTWANILGVTATSLAAIQYIPQIWTTWQLGEVGSLSIPTMLIQTPGSFVWAGSLAARLGMEGWSTWGIFVVTGVFQGCLLVMGIMFEVQRRRADTGTQEPSDPDHRVGGHLPEHRDLETDDEGNAMVGSPSERSPLLSRSRRQTPQDSLSSRANGKSHN